MKRQLWWKLRYAAAPHVAGQLLINLGYNTDARWRKVEKRNTGLMSSLGEEELQRDPPTRTDEY